MGGQIEFIDFERCWISACMELFDQNSPQFFAENERADYLRFLKSMPDVYKLAVLEGHVVGAFGLSPGSVPGRPKLSWILISPALTGHGIGSMMMLLAKNIALQSNAKVVSIAASHLSVSFFERFGAVELGRTPNGWGQGMHRVDMEWVV